MPRTAPKPKFGAHYQPKFKVGEEVLYDGVEYFVDVADNQTNEFLPLRRRCRPYSRPCIMAPIAKLKKNNFIARKSLKRGMWVFLDADTKPCMLSIILERCGDEITIQPLNVRHTYTISIFSNCIDPAIDVTVPVHIPRIQILSNPCLQALISINGRGAKIIDYDADANLYLAKRDENRTFVWLEDKEFTVDYSDADPFDTNWECSGILTIPFEDLVISESGISYKKIQMSTIDMEAVKLDLWARTCHQNINHFATKYKTDMDILYIVLWLEHHSIYWSKQTESEFYDDDNFCMQLLIDKLANAETVDIEVINNVNKRIKLDEWLKRRSSHIESKIRSKPIFKTNFEYANGKVIVKIMNPSNPEIRMNRLKNRFTFTHITKVLWHLSNKPGARSWIESRDFTYRIKNNYATIRLKHRLKPFQERVVYEMRQREMNHHDILTLNTSGGVRFNAVSGFDWEYPFRGGILALDTGLGKTVCTLALIQQGILVYKIKPTLVVVPLTLIDQWIQELQKFTTLSYGEIHGRKTIDKCIDKDVVFTTYGTLMSTYNKNYNDHLFNMFKRVVFDESHQLKSHSSSTVRACYALNATYRWCLTATPILNDTIQNLHAQLKMLCIKPFERDRQYLKEVMQIEEDHSKWIIHQITNIIIRPEVSVDIPTPKTYIRNIEFDNNTQVVYRKLMEIIRTKISTTWANGGPFSEYQRIKSLINQLCIASIDPTLIPIHAWGERLKEDQFSTTTVETLHETLGKDKFEEEVKRVLNCLEDTSCSLCLETISRPTITNCLHIFCHDCIKRSLEFRKQCPMCRGTLQENTFKEIKQTMEEETIDGFVIKTDTLGRRVKIDRVLASLYQKMTRRKLQELKRIISNRKKIVVYSQYNTVLESFSQEIPSSIITGRSSRAQRKQNIDSFKRGDTNVFFLSTKIADVGINLTEGDTLVFLEPGIDSDVEKQAVGRLTRIGQDKAIHIYKLYSKQTLEDTISLERPKYEQAISNVMCSGGSKSYISKKKKQYYLGYITSILKFN
jgi:SNF2 family DNA or RNA helicase